MTGCIAGPEPTGSGAATAMTRFRAGAAAKPRRCAQSERARVSDSNTDDGAGGVSGTLTLNDGSVLSLSEIERVIRFTPGRMIATTWGSARWTCCVRGTTRSPGWAAALPGLRVDLVVSPQHRMLLTGGRLRQVTGLSDAFAPARHLLDGGLVVVAPCARLRDIHLLLDAHDVLAANGAACESFLPGSMGLGAFSGRSQDRLFRALPSLRSDPGRYGPPARQVLRAADTRAVWGAALPMGLCG